MGQPVYYTAPQIDKILSESSILIKSIQKKNRCNLNSFNKSLLILLLYVSVSSKPDHPPGKPLGNFFEIANSPPPGHKESAKSRPLAEAVKSWKNPTPGAIIFKNPAKKTAENMRQKL